MSSDENNMNDQELDAAFKEAAQSFTPDFQESDWAAMSEVLSNLPESKPKGVGFDFKKRWLIVLLFACLGLLTAIGWLYINRPGSEMAQVEYEKNSNSAEPVFETNTLPNAENIKAVDNEIEESRREFIQDIELESESEPKQVQKKTFVQSATSAETRLEKGFVEVKENGVVPSHLESQKDISEIDKQSKISANLPSIKSERTFSSNENIDYKPSTSGSTIETQLIDKGFVVKENELEDGTSATEEVFKRTAFGLLEKLESKSMVFPTENSFNHSIEGVNYLANETLASPVIPLVFQKGLSVRLAYSPDFSTVNSDFLKVGNNSAFLLEYRLNNRFTIESGVIKSLKIYSASSADYTWPEQWGISPTDLSGITATCDMLDIPLNVRFDISQNPRSRIFINAGTTNYLMLNELYEYSYYNTPAKWTSWEGKTGFYAFSVLNLSSGFEKSISRKISVQLEPFVKIPVRQLGFGKVRLTTIGVFASAKIKL